MNFILGGGITGLTVALYFKTFTVLTKGKGQDAFPVGPKILRKTNSVDSFIEKFISKNRKEGEDLLKSRIYKCGYFIKGKFTDKITKAQKEEYLKKTRGLNWKDYIDSGMNNEITEVEGYDMRDIYINLLNNFDLKTRRVFLNIKKISSKRSVISGVNPIHKDVRMALIYNKVINTLPSLLFNFLIEGEFGYKTNSQIYICLVQSKKFADDMGEFDFVYFPGSNFPFYRITKISDSGNLTIESRVPFLPKRDLPFECKVLKFTQLPFGKIAEDLEPMEVENIVHVGRWALNDNALRLHDLIEKLENKEIRV